MIEAGGRLLEEGELTRASTYMAIIVQALVVKAIPYCIGVYPVGKGHDSCAMVMVHSTIQKAVARAGVTTYRLSNDAGYRKCLVKQQPSQESS